MLARLALAFFFCGSNAMATISVSVLPTVNMAAICSGTSGLLVISKDGADNSLVIPNFGACEGLNLLSDFANADSNDLTSYVVFGQNSKIALLTVSNNNQNPKLIAKLDSSPSNLILGNFGFRSMHSTDGLFTVGLLADFHVVRNTDLPQKLMMHNLSADCAAKLSNLLGPGNQVDDKWIKSQAIVSDFLKTNASSCGDGSTYNLFEIK